MTATNGVNLKFFIQSKAELTDLMKCGQILRGKLEIVCTDKNGYVQGQDAKFVEAVHKDCWEGKILPVLPVSEFFTYTY